MRYFLAALLFVSPALAQPGVQVTTIQGTINVAAGASVPINIQSVQAGLITMSPGSGQLPNPDGLGKLWIIAPSACSITVNWFGGATTATSGEQMGSGTLVAADGVDLSQNGPTQAPTIFSTAGCSNVQFRN